MSKIKNILPDNIDELKNIIFSLQNIYTELQAKYQSAQEEIESLHQKYKSALVRYISLTKEKISQEHAEQLGLFNECETFIDEEKKEKPVHAEESITIKEYTRKKGGKKKIPDYLPVEEHIDELSKSEKECKYSGKTNPVIGEDHTEELDIIPMQIKKVVHIAKNTNPAHVMRFLIPAKKRSSKLKNRKE